MFKIKFIRLNYLLLTFVALNAFSADEAKVNQDANQKSSLEVTVHYCPLIADLVKENLLWSSRNGAWKSYSQSFAKKIDYFIGAEWIGVNIGKIICLYQGKGSFDFPIALEPATTNLILEPKGDTWHPEQKGYKICKSNNITDCPFFTKREETDVDIYEVIKYRGRQGEANDN